jgi:hypothetical protein
MAQTHHFSPPGRDQLMKPPRQLPTRFHKKRFKGNSLYHDRGFDSTPPLWDRASSSPVPALSALSYAPSSSLNRAAQTGVYSFYFSRFRIYRRFRAAVDKRSSSRTRLFPSEYLLQVGYRSDKRVERMTNQSLYLGEKLWSSSAVKIEAAVDQKIHIIDYRLHHKL